MICSLLICERIFFIMNIDFEAALRYIDLGAYDNAVQSLQKAINTENEKNNHGLAIEYRCVLGELYFNLQKGKEAREEFAQVIEYCKKNGTHSKQLMIASRYTDILDGKVKPAADKALAPRTHVPLVPKPMQNKEFISRQMNKKHR